MPRLTNTQGVVVSVSEETATRLGAEWQPVKAKATPAAKPAAKG